MKIRHVVFGALFAVILAGSASAKVSDAEWKELKAEFQRLWADARPEAKNTGIAKLGMADRAEAAQILIGLLSWKDERGVALMRARDELMGRIDRMYQMGAKAAGKPGYVSFTSDEKKQLEKLEADLKKLDDDLTASSFVRHTAIKALGGTKDSEALKLLHTKGLDDTRWEVRAGVAQALGAAGNESSKPFVRKKIKDKDHQVATSAIDAAAALNDAEAVDDICSQLSSTSWQTKSAAVKALARLKPTKAVGPLVKAIQPEKGRLQEDIDEALERITGFSFGGDPASWQRWWEASKDRLEEVIKTRQAAAKEEKAKGKTVSFYGIESRSKKLCFVIDISGSMMQKAGTPGTAVSGRDANYPVNGTKLDVAKYELIQAIKALPADATFNIVYFSTTVRVYSPTGMLKADRNTKLRTETWIRDTLKPEGLTNIYDALDQAFSLAGRDEGANYKASIDTIYFLTDGVPTHGRIKEVDKILAELGGRNKTRKIKIHVIGVGKERELDVKFLKALAEQNDGTFVHRE